MAIALSSQPICVPKVWLTARNGKRPGVIRVNRDCLLEQRLGRDIILAGHPPIVRQGAHHQIPSVQAVGRLAFGAKIFRRIDLRLDRADNGLADLVLHREHVGEVAVVAFRPKRAAGRDVIELCGDTHAVAALTHAALDQIPDAELLGDLSDVDGLALVGEG
jgi:hypothetical protein